MNPAALLFTFFFLVPLGEIYLLIKVGGLIGAMPTIGLVILTAALGAWMLRRQGFATLRRAQAALEQGILPARELLEGVILLIGGALLLTPGFITDILGFACLFPPTRLWLINQLIRHVQILHPTSAQPGTQADGRVIEGEWRREDEPENREDERRISRDSE